jgi:hypothetical protein
MLAELSVTRFTGETMPFSDPEKKKQYQKELMAKRRAKARAKEQKEIEETLGKFQGFNLWTEPKKKQEEELQEGEYIIPDYWFRD